MSTIVYPYGGVYTPLSVEWGLKFPGGAWTSPYTGDVTTIEYPWPRIVCSLTFNNRSEAEAGAREALFARLHGRANRLQLWNMKRPRPLGTQFAAAAVKTSALQGATSLTLKSATVGATLKTGDWFGVGGMLFMCTADATVSGAAEVTLTFEPPARNAIAADAVVTFDRPTALFIADGDELRHSGLRGRIAGPFSIGFTEDIT